MSSTSDFDVGSQRDGSNQNLFLIQPTQDYESFLKYIRHLNKLIKMNLPFLKAKFGVTTLTITSVLTNSSLLTEGMKKKLFDTKLAQSTVLV